MRSTEVLVGVTEGVRLKKPLTAGQQAPCKLVEIIFIPVMPPLSKSYHPKQIIRCGVLRYVYWVFIRASVGHSSTCQTSSIKSSVSLITRELLYAQITMSAPSRSPFVIPRAPIYALALRSFLEGWSRKFVVFFSRTTCGLPPSRWDKPFFLPSSSGARGSKSSPET